MLLQLPQALSSALRLSISCNQHQLGTSFFTHVPGFQEEPLALGAVSTPVSFSDGPLLSPVSSIPLSFQRETLRSPWRYPVSFSDGPLLCPVSSIPPPFRRETLRSSWRCLQFFIQYKNDTVSSRVPGLKAEDLHRPSRSPFSAKRVQLTLSRGIVRWSRMGAGTSALQVIDGSHTCLYYSLPIQHISVPWVLHTQ